MGSKRKTLDLATIIIIMKIQKGKGSKADIMLEYDVVEKGGRNMKMKKLQGADHEDVEKDLLAWFNQSRGQNMTIMGPMIQEKTNLFAIMLKVDGFKCSTGWLDRFKRQNGITWHKVVRESAAVPCGVMEQWLLTVHKILERYSPQDIYNTDETGVVYNLMPDCTLVAKGDTCKGGGGKRSKECLTVLLCANMDGSDKGDTLPCCYDYNKKAWMTSDLFTKWLKAFNACVSTHNMKVIMFIDNCPAHPSRVTQHRACVPASKRHQRIAANGPGHHTAVIYFTVHLGLAYLN
ncbi:hypothetical protein PR048_013210 [Dryococelus australis]|uniref:HTH CENPB-type domain-containing protein n=1 Tax=Dryococelus australis TaxID=614101 RepID=A0ABQ9HRI8_9NEOP|nr:hypothetical protein PR048_013210 [Dryococelus australis]